MGTSPAPWPKFLGLLPMDIGETWALGFPCSSRCDAGHYLLEASGSVAETFKGSTLRSLTNRYRGQVGVNCRCVAIFLQYLPDLILGYDTRDLVTTALGVPQKPVTRSRVVRLLISSAIAIDIKPSIHYVSTSVSPPLSFPLTLRP